MNPEDKYNIKYWKILKNIKDKILFSDNNLIEYKIYSGILIVGHDEPSQEDELIILKKIEKEGGVKILQDSTGLIYTGLTDLRLGLIILPKFDEIYNKYKDMNTEFNNKKQEKVGILNTGKNNTFIGNTFHGHDIGIKDEGEGTSAKDNKFFSSSHNVKKHKSQNVFERVTNNQIFAYVFGSLIFIGILYFIYIKSGINLSQFN